MTVKVGGREQIASFRLLVPEGEDAWIEFTAGTWNIRINIQFDDNAGESGTFDLTGMGDYAILLLKKWVNPLPAVNERMVLLGETDGRKVVFQLYGSAVRGVKCLDMFFYWEKENG